MNNFRTDQCVRDLLGFVVLNGPLTSAIFSHTSTDVLSPCAQGVWKFQKSRIYTMAIIFLSSVNLFITFNLFTRSSAGQIIGSFLEFHRSFEVDGFIHLFEVLTRTACFLIFPPCSIKMFTLVALSNPLKIFIYILSSVRTSKRPILSRIVYFLVQHNVDGLLLSWP